MMRPDGLVRARQIPRNSIRTCSCVREYLWVCVGLRRQRGHLGKNVGRARCGPVVYIACPPNLVLYPLMNTVEPAAQVWGTHQT